MTDCISLLFQKVEAKHGYMMVAHSLAFVTASMNGITESEIEDIISLGEYLRHSDHLEIGPCVANVRTNQRPRLSA